MLMNLSPRVDMFLKSVCLQPLALAFSFSGIYANVLECLYSWSFWFVSIVPDHASCLGQAFHTFSDDPLLDLTQSFNFDCHGQYASSTAVEESAVKEPAVSAVFFTIVSPCAHTYIPTYSCAHTHPFPPYLPAWN